MSARIEFNPRAERWNWRFSGLGVSNYFSVEVVDAGLSRTGLTNAAGARSQELVMYSQGGARRTRERGKGPGHHIGALKYAVYDR